jgi:predicted nucleotidyltransferase
LDPRKVIKSFKPQKTLEPKLWKNNKLDPRVRKVLLKVADDFIGRWKLKKQPKIKDIRFTGSLANFNWSKFSDVDLHVIVDFGEVNKDTTLVDRFFSLAKYKWNKDHNINIGPYEIEVYVEDEGEDHTATGLFSVKDNKWIKEPEESDPDYDEKDIMVKAKYFFDLYGVFLSKFKKGEYDEVVQGIEKTKEKIRKMRSSGLEKEGEFSTENLTFKVLRRTELLDKMNDLLTKATDKQLSETKKRQGG